MPANQVFYINGWRICFRGIVPVTTWNSKGAAAAQLSLLESAVDTINDRGVIKHGSCR